jgi:predicted nucleic acid-binding protein
VSDYVVDASVAAKWLLEEDHTQEALWLLRDPESELHAPDFLLAETDNFLLKRVRLGHMNLSEARGARATLRNIPIRMHSTADCLDAAFDLAAETGQSVYDCMYLVVAMRLSGVLATADGRFYKALAGTDYARFLVWVADLGA